MSIRPPQGELWQPLAAMPTSAARVALEGTFSPNLREPVHRWFRYSAGFSAPWVRQAIIQRKPERVLDPFVGSGTVCIACDELGVASVGVEAHPFVARIAQAKLSWNCALEEFAAAALEVRELAKRRKEALPELSPLLQRCFEPDAIRELIALRDAYHQVAKNFSPACSKLLFLAITAIIRKVSHVGTAQWQYVLPSKRKRSPKTVSSAWSAQVSDMLVDMEDLQRTARPGYAQLVSADFRVLEPQPNTVDLVVTSPPYANNYDYADATRLEMTFWGEIAGWSELQSSVRKYLVRSSSQHAAAERLDLANLLSHAELLPIRESLSSICNELKEVKVHKGGRKAYDSMVAAYFIDMSIAMRNLRNWVRNGGQMCWVVGDSAPYGVHVPVDDLLAQLALFHGFRDARFEKIRDRNTKWKNRKHRVPLQEGRLWIDA